METKICGKCKQEKPVSDFYPSKRDGYRSRCKLCHREDCKEYAKTGYWSRYNREYFRKPEVKKHINNYRREYNKRPDVRIKVLARWYTKNEIKTSRVRREPCAFCGREQVEAHHKDYTQPLLIVWLCASCHHQIHQAQKE